MLAYALADHWDRTAPEQETMHLERMLFDPGSPGAAFRLRDRDLVGVLERMPTWTGLRYDETAGQRTIIRDGRRKPLDILLEHYRCAV